MVRGMENNYGEPIDDETRPLLSSRPTDLRGDAAEQAEPILLNRRTRCSWPWTVVVLLCMCLAIVGDIGETLYVAPRVRLFESVACTQYYLKNDPSLVGQDGSVPERFCKIDSVQSKLASVLGWQLFFDSIPAIILPVPYGYIADIYGRKWVMVLALLGYAVSWAWTLFSIGVLHLPLEYVWLSSLFFLIGGGPTTGTTLITTVVADVVPPELRSTVFFYRFCTDLIADLFIPPVTFLLMNRNMWIPLLLAVVFQGLSAIIALGLPETLPLADSEHSDDNNDSSLVATTSAEIDKQCTLNVRCISWLRQVVQSFSFVTRHRAIMALIFTFLISKVGRQATNILFQYVSKKYMWTVSEAGLLVSLRAAVNIALFTLILPAVMKFAFPMTNAASRDLWIGKASILLLTIGSLIIFLSETASFMIVGLIVSTLGAGFPPIIRSLVTYLVESSHADQTSDIGRLYALISVMEGVGSLVAGPGMASIFRLGISWGHRWLGLPFGLAAVLFALVSVLVFSIKV